MHRLVFTEEAALVPQEGETMKQDHLLGSTSQLGIRYKDMLRAAQTAQTSMQKTAHASALTIVHAGTDMAENTMRVAGVLRILEQYRFGVIAQARLFGIDEVAVFMYEDLLNAVHLNAVIEKNPEIWERINYIEKIHAALTDKFGDDIPLHLQWLQSTPMVSYDSYRDALELGNLNDLWYAASNCSRTLGLR